MIRETSGKRHAKQGYRIGDVRGSILRSYTRSADIVARYGGEEFVMLLPETEEETAVVTADKLRAVIERQAFTPSDRSLIHVTASFGISSLDMTDQNNTDIGDRMAKMADDAMRQAKQSGRNRVVVYSGM
jgi:diguanylate cyclase (GGDEF)-like protein